jgi:RND family efflux transporter MFP subunit
MIDYATLKAPFPGVVTRRTLDPGDLVQSKDGGDAGQALFVVSQIDTVRVRIPVPEADAALVNRGDKMTLTLPFFPAEAPITGSVTRFAQSLDRSTRTMLVEADIENPDGKLLPGMFGQATIDLSTKVAAHTLPARAVRFDETGNAYVYVVGSDDTVTVTDVETGIDNGTVIEIRSGVEAGQRVIDAHRERFTSGQKVTVLEK